MKTYPTANIRNVALVGHSGSGKTTLVEALLARSGATARIGRVEDGTTLSDTEPEEVKRRISLSLAVAPVEWDGCKLNFLDTPGYADFMGEVEAALSVADLAVFVVSAVDGVEVQTEVIWRRCVELGLPRMVFVNKEDKERADFHRVLAQLRDTFGSGFAPLELPIGEEAAFHGVADLLSDQAFAYEADGKHHTEPMPPELEDEEHRVHDELVEEIVSGDDEQLERYLAGEVPTVEELERALAHEVVEGTEFPVVVGSALTGVGIDRLADFICRIGPSPVSRPVTVRAGDQEVPVAAEESGQPLAYVFRTIADPFVGQLSLFKVLSGTIKVDDHLVNVRSGTDERLHGLFHLRGKEQTPAPSLLAGDIGAVAKLTATHTGDTLAPKGSPVRVVAIPPPPAVLSFAVRPRTQADDDKLGGALQRLQAEDQALVIERNEETRQTLLRGVGETHLAVSLERLARKFGVNVDTEEVRVPYRETITGNAEAEGKVKKQTGGHGQFAVANLRVEPVGRGEGFSFVDSIVGGAIPRQYIPAVQKGIEDTMATGGVHGFPVVDVKVQCYDGKYHNVDSSEMAFRTAASVGFKDALSKAGVVVLEPVSLLTVRVPSSYQGDVMGDINSRRGRVQGTNTDGGFSEVSALVPTAEILRYAIDLRSMTGGRGSFTATHDHYDVLPSHLVDRAKATLVAAHS
ncbi:MAG TPA: elongation factor G [Acidimicrobiales bacterium]|nr:elongation factor G [Acidimicrobiales bacterium]